MGLFFILMFYILCFILINSSDGREKGQVGNLRMVRCVSLQGPSPVCCNRQWIWFTWEWCWELIHSYNIYFPENALFCWLNKQIVLIGHMSTLGFTKGHLALLHISIAQSTNLSFYKHFSEKIANNTKFSSSGCAQR